jgi:hypothetical protein
MKDVVKMGNSLIRPEDIIDAEDGSDLLSKLVERNITRVDDRTFELEQQRWLQHEITTIKEGYKTRAEEAYKKVWKRCHRSKVGHNKVHADVMGRTLTVCDTCGYVETDYGDYDFGRRRQAALDYRAMQIKGLAKKMIEADEKAEKLVWPTEDDFPPVKKAKAKEGVPKPWWR